MDFSTLQSPGGQISHVVFADLKISFEDGRVLKIVLPCLNCAIRGIYAFMFVNDVIADDRTYFNFRVVVSASDQCCQNEIMISLGSCDGKLAAKEMSGRCSL